jgi:hypothetical protein
VSPSAPAPWSGRVKRSFWHLAKDGIAEAVLELSYIKALSSKTIQSASIAAQRKGERHIA